MTKDTYSHAAPVVRRLNWGCGHQGAPGWINSDLKTGRDIDISCNILDGLPLASDSIEYAVSIHALPELGFADLIPALKELRRVLKPGGVLRLGLPDLIKGVKAYLADDLDYFLIPDTDGKSIGAKLITQLVWYGYSRTLFISDFAEEILRSAGFVHVHHCRFKETASAFAEITELDDRPLESFFVEAVK